MTQCIFPFLGFQRRGREFRSRQLNIRTRVTWVMLTWLSTKRLKPGSATPALLKRKYLEWYRDIYVLTHKIMRGEMTDIKGNEVQLWRERADEYVREMAIIVKKITGNLP